MFIFLIIVSCYHNISIGGVYPGKTRCSFLFTNNRHLACADRSYLMGVSGTVAQYLFQHRHFNTEWLTSVRLLVSGALLLGIAYRKEKGRIWAVWKDRRDRIPLLLFGIFGMLGVQYTYFAAIEYGNAATATVLQYLGPAIITCF